MISTYRMIGKLRMKEDGFNAMSPTEQKKYIIRQFVAEDSSFTYKNKQTKDQEYGRMVLMNLDSQNKTIDFSVGIQLGLGQCAEHLIFLNYAPGDPNIYATHSGYKSIMAFSLWEYMQTNRKKINWSEPERVDECLAYLKQIRMDFFVEDKHGIRPNYRLLPEKQQTGFPDPELDESLAQFADPKDKDAKKQWGKVTKSYFEKSLADITGEKQAFTLTIDGKFIHEIPQIAPCYIDVLYYHIIDKQFSDSKTKGVCHLCSLETSLASDVSLKQKFYGTTNKYYFDQTVKTRNYAAFSMCNECYEEVTVGTQVSASKFRTFLLNMSCLVLPEISFCSEDDPEVIEARYLQAIPRLLRNQSRSGNMASLETVKKLQTKMEDFCLFFYNKPSATSQEFIVNRLIKSISLASLIAKSEALSQLSIDHELPSIFNEEHSLSFEDLRFMILPSQESHPNLKPQDYQKINRDMLSLLSAYLYSQPMDYGLLIKRFVDIFSRKLLHAGDKAIYRLNLSPYLMNLFINHLIDLNQLKGIKPKEVTPMTTQLENTKLLEYFKNNAEVYENNRHAQGLFILGWFVAEVEYEQRKKGINRTAIHKLNLRGIPTQKVKTFMAITDDLRQVWKVHNDPITEAYFRESMNNIENASISPEEVIYHILSGRSYNSYIAITEYKKKQLEKQNLEDHND